MQYIYIQSGTLNTWCFIVVVYVSWNLHKFCLYSIYCCFVPPTTSIRGKQEVQLLESVGSKGINLNSAPLEGS